VFELGYLCSVLVYALFTFCTIQVYITNTESISHDKRVERYNTALQHLSATLTRGKGVRLGYMLVYFKKDVAKEKGKGRM
jgi:hypothetical protein